MKLHQGVAGHLASLSSGFAARDFQQLLRIEPQGSETLNPSRQPGVLEGPTLPSFQILQTAGRVEPGAQQGPTNSGHEYRENYL